MTAARSRRRICVVTTSRADYGLLYWILRDLRADKRVRLQLIVTGMHFSRSHGNTHELVRSDGFLPAAEIRAAPADDSERAAAASLARILHGLSTELEHLQPDLVVVLGDRYELLAVAAAATIFRLPIVHLHGGESTEGVIDDAVRNAVSKLSHLHLPAAREYAARLRAIGEEPRRIRVFGTPGLDHLTRTRIRSTVAVLRRLGIPDDDRPLFLVTHHPVTLVPGASLREARALARALRGFAARIVITAPNADPEHGHIFRELKRSASADATAVFVANLGTPWYLGLLRSADVVIGNSSSGIIEAPSFGVPVVNIGDRQAGRLRATNVIDVAPQAAEIRRAIARALTPAFRRTARRAKNPYGRPGASRKIARYLATVRLDAALLRKQTPTGAPR